MYGSQRYIVGMGYNATTVFLQEPFLMGFLTPRTTRRTAYVE
jgi:hypothetical protein